jgi:hypothetical protein
VITAYSEKNAKELLESSGLEAETLYELKADTFTGEGFLVTQK